MKPTLVLLHGVASNSTRWAEFIATSRLRRSWRVVAVDLRGNGANAFPRTRLGMDVWCADIAALLDASGAERAALGGHCLGANIALQFAARYPQRVDALVLVEPMPPAALIGQTRALAALRPVLNLIYGVARGLNALGIYRRRLERLDLREWDRATRAGKRKLSMLGTLGVDLRSTPIAAYVRMLAATAQAWPEVEKLGMPALALVSSRSTMTDAARTRQALARLPDCDIVEIDAVHWIPTEQPAAMRRAIDRWLARRGREKGP